MWQSLGHVIALASGSDYVYGNPVTLDATAVRELIDGADPPLRDHSPLVGEGVRGPRRRAHGEARQLGVAAWQEASAGLLRRAGCGVGLLEVIESGNWRSDADLAEVYTAWGGFAYGRGLAGEPAHVFRARVVNPRWLATMRRHDYKGAFEIAASVDYLFSFDATAQVVGDWMYESVAQTYLLDDENQACLRHATRGHCATMVERLQESVDRGMWEDPDPELINRLHELYLEVEGDLEG
ncbi:MAG: cobaltochelatase subunit CobN [Propionibacteriaceae bacterium]|nr:cobaltochelatase subunit CobN [Propionibacteriaceae bacterium]